MHEDAGFHHPVLDAALDRAGDWGGYLDHFRTFAGGSAGENGAGIGASCGPILRVSKVGHYVSALKIIKN